MNYKLILDTLERLTNKLVDQGYEFSKKDSQMYEQAVREVKREFYKDL